MKPREARAIRLQSTLFDNVHQKGRPCPQNLAPKVTYTISSRWSGWWKVQTDSFPHLNSVATRQKPSNRNARMIQVRHRSHATYSRQPRQVRKEATVTGSCVCSEFPVPDLLFPRKRSIVLTPSDYGNLHFVYHSFRKKRFPEHPLGVGRSNFNNGARGKS